MTKTCFAIYFRPCFFMSIPRAVVFQPFFFSRYGCLLRTLDKLNPKNSKSSQNNCIAKFLGLFHPTSLLVFTYNIQVLLRKCLGKSFLRDAGDIVRIHLFDGIIQKNIIYPANRSKMEAFSLLATLKRTNRP